MIKHIKSKSHVQSGKLLKSIDFKCSYVGGKLDIRFETLDYVQYLDDGNFLDAFVEIDAVADIIGDFYVEQFYEDLDN